MTSTETSDAGKPTLGDLLYRDASRPPFAEEEWVAQVAAIAAGDQLALHALYQRTHRIVFTLTMRITGNRQTAEELTLDVFHDVWRRAAGFDSRGGTVVGWIMNQARSRAIDRLRFEGRKKRVNPHPEVQGSETGTADSDTLVRLSDQARQVSAGLATLTTDERQAIEQAFLSELTYVQVAEQLQLPLGTVKTRIRTGLAKLRRALASEVAP